MRYLSRFLVLLGPVVLSATTLVTPVAAAETSNSDYTIIQSNDVLTDDLYAAAIRVVVDGRIEGDLVAFAAEEVVINGSVTGSVVAVAPKVTINGVVEGSVRASGGVLEITGSVQRDVVAAVRAADLSADSVVDGEVIVWGWQVRALGSIGEDLTGTQRNLALAGAVGRDVDVTVVRLDIVDTLTVGGDLAYRSRREATGLEKADVTGTVVAKAPLDPNIRLRALSLLGRFMIVLFLTVSGLTVAYGWPTRTASAVSMVGTKPIRRWLAGALVIFAPLILLAITGVILGLAPAAAAFPLLVVLVPVILALVGLSFAASLVAGAPVAGWLGGVVLRRRDLYKAILAGSVVLGAIWFLPVVAWAVPVVALPLGLGAWFAAMRQPASVASDVSTEGSSAPSSDQSL